MTRGNGWNPSGKRVDAAGILRLRKICANICNLNLFYEVVQMSNIRANIAMRAEPVSPAAGGAVAGARGGQWCSHSPRNSSRLHQTVRIDTATFAATPI